MRRMNRRQNVRLFMFGRQSGRGSAALDIYDHQRRLRHRRQADRLGHQRKSRSGCSRERPSPCIIGAKRHHTGRYLVFGLDHDAAAPRQLLDQDLHDFRSRCDRIGCHQFHAGSQRPLGNRFIAGQVVPRYAVAISQPVV